MSDKAKNIIYQFCFSSVQAIDLDMSESLLHRATLKSDMIREFSSHDALYQNFRFGIIGLNGKLEEGIGAGVNKEVIAAFFEDFYSSCCCGADELVPIVRHDMLKYEWEAVARIICYATKVHYFPIRLSQAFMLSAFFNEESVTKSQLKSSFLKVISQDEREILEQNFVTFGENTDELMDVLTTYKCYSMPTAENLEEIVMQLAYQEIIQKPRYIAACWHSIFKAVRFPSNMNPVNMSDIYKMVLPTGDKIVGLFHASPSSDQERQCMDHLKRFTKNLPDTDLQKFLRIMTGADVVTVDKIDISFSSLNSLGRRPVFRTCGPTLELPNTYTCYNELAEEFQNILNSPKGAFVFDIV